MLDFFLDPCTFEFFNLHILSWGLKLFFICTKCLQKYVKKMGIVSVIQVISFKKSPEKKLWKMLV